LKKKILRSLALLFIPPIGAFIIKALYHLNKIHYIIEDDDINESPAIFAIWHGDLLMLSYLYKYYRKETKGKVLISDHFDGLLISKTIKYFGFETIAGSTNKNAIKALLKAIKALKEGYDIGITPDGPKGPRHSVSDGIIMMAKKSNAKIVLVEIKPTKYWQFNSWDKFKVPKPFGSIYFYAKKVDIKDLSDDEAREVIKKGLLAHD
jgi:lysophospholipid acyltransferase (LPLAT)-like uncharacterized protein